MKLDNTRRVWPHIFGLRFAFLSQEERWAPKLSMVRGFFLLVPLAVPVVARFPQWYYFALLFGASMLSGLLMHIFYWAWRTGSFARYMDARDQLYRTNDIGFIFYALWIFVFSAAAIVKPMRNEMDWVWTVLAISTPIAGVLAAWKLRTSGVGPVQGFVVGVRSYVDDLSLGVVALVSGVFLLAFQILAAGGSSSRSDASAPFSGTSGSSSSTPSDEPAAADRNWRIDGRKIAANGTISDLGGWSVGRIDGQGNVYDRSGWKIGRIDNEGRVYDHSGFRRGHYTSDGKYHKD